MEDKKLAEESNLKVKIRPWRPTWRPKADPGGHLGDPGAQGGQLKRRKVPQDANLEAERLPRRPTLEAKGGPKGAKRLQK